jgi:protein NrfD
MKEELFVSGRNIPNIDPYLNIWHWQIPVYLFLGGLAAGILFFAALFTIMGKEKEMPAAVRTAPIIAPIALILGLFALFLDLKHKLFFWQLYTTIRIESPMSWGAWGADGHYTSVNVMGGQLCERTCAGMELEISPP